VCDLETSTIGAPYIYDISNPRVNQNWPVFWSIVVKEIPTVVSSFLGGFPSSHIPKTTKDVNVPFFIHSSKVTEQYSFYFRSEKLQFSQLVCDNIWDPQFHVNDTVDSRAIDFIEQVNIEDIAGIEVKSA
jgi:hypothetical protein